VRLWAAKVNDVAAVIALGEGMLNVGSSGVVVGSEEDGLRWWMLGDTLVSTKAPSARGDQEGRVVRFWPSAGYFIAREPARERGGWYVLADAGPHGGDVTGHAHTDIGHIEVACGPTRIIVDSGSFVYASDPQRRYRDRGLQSHASVEIDGDQLAEPAGIFGWRRIPNAPVVTCDAVGESPWLVLRHVTHRGALHERAVCLIAPVGIVIIDQIDMPRPGKAVWYWPLGSVVGMTPDDPAIRCGRVVLWAKGSMAWETKVEPWTYAPDFGIEVPSSRARMTAALPAGRSVMATSILHEAAVGSLVESDAAPMVEARYDGMVWTVSLSAGRVSVARRREDVPRDA
jgi:hypothetical protein